MSRPVKVTSIDELKSRKKARKLKMKEPEVEAHELSQAMSTGTPKIKGQSTEIVVKWGKMKAAELEEDIDNIIVKIPAGLTAISDPSSLNPFIKKLLLEEDEQMLSQIGPVETMKKAAALTYQAMECNLYMQQYVESNLRKQREMEKSLAAMKKEMAEMKSSFEKKNKALENELKEVKATLKMERDISEVTIEGYKDALDNVRKENGELVEQIEGIALESMMKERSNLMKDFLERKTVSWEPQKWIQEYERLVAGLSSSNEGDVEGKEEEVDSKDAGKEIKEAEGD